MSLVDMFCYLDNCKISLQASAWLGEVLRLRGRSENNHPSIDDLYSAEPAADRLLTMLEDSV